MAMHNAMQSVRLLADGMRSFDQHCAQGIEVDEARVAELLQRSLMLATALAPVIGYDQTARVALQAHREGRTLREVALELGVVTPEQFDQLVDPARMLGPRPV